MEVADMHMLEMDVAEMRMLEMGVWKHLKAWIRHEDIQRKTQVANIEIRQGKLDHVSLCNVDQKMHQ